MLQFAEKQTKSALHETHLLPLLQLPTPGFTRPHGPIAFDC